MARMMAKTMHGYGTVVPFSLAIFLSMTPASSLKPHPTFIRPLLPHLVVVSPPQARPASASAQPCPAMVSGRSAWVTARATGFCHSPVLGRPGAVPPSWCPAATHSRKGILGGQSADRRRGLLLQAPRRGVGRAACTMTASSLLGIEDGRRAETQTQACDYTTLSALAAEIRCVWPTLTHTHAQTHFHSRTVTCKRVHAVSAIPTKRSFSPFLLTPPLAQLGLAPPRRRSLPGRRDGHLHPLLPSRRR